MPIIRTRWDPVQLDYVEVDRQPSIFRLQRLGPGRAVAFDDATSLEVNKTILSELAEEDESIAVNGEKVATLRNAGDWPPYQCVFPNFSIDCWSSRVIFQCERLDAAFTHAVGQFATKSRLALVLPNQIYLFSPETQDVLPRLWVGSIPSSVIEDSQQLDEILSLSHDAQASPVSSEPTALQSMPGVWPQRSCVEFVECTSPDDFPGCFEELWVFWVDWKEKYELARGTMRQADSHIEIDGRYFMAVEYTGAAVLAMITAFCERVETKHGYVSNFSDLLISDGVTLDMAKVLLL